MNALTVIPPSPVTLAEWQAHYKGVRQRLQTINIPDAREAQKALSLIVFIKTLERYAVRQAHRSATKLIDMKFRLYHNQRVRFDGMGPITPKKIIAFTGAEFGFSPNDILSERRNADLALARHVAMWLTKELTGKSYPKIGRAFGDRDHSTSMHAVARITRLIGEDAAFYERVMNLRDRIEAKRDCHEAMQNCGQTPLTRG